MGPIGFPEMLVILVVALIIFGPRKLPELGRTLGQALTEFRRASNDLRNAFEDEVREMEREARKIEKEVQESVIAPVTEATAVPREEEKPTDGEPRPA